MGEGILREIVALSSLPERFFDISANASLEITRVNATLFNCCNNEALNLLLSESTPITNRYCRNDLLCNLSEAHVIKPTHINMQSG